MVTDLQTLLSVRTAQIQTARPPVRLMSYSAKLRDSLPILTYRASMEATVLPLREKGPVISAGSRFLRRGMSTETVLPILLSVRRVPRRTAIIQERAISSSARLLVLPPLSLCQA